MASKPAVSILQRLKALLPFSNRFTFFSSYPTYHTVFTSADVESFADKGYASNPDVFAAIREITTKCSAIPWKVYDVKNQKALARFKAFDPQGRVSFEGRRAKDEALEANDTHPLNDLFYKPNYLQTWTEFVEAVFAFKHIMGNSFIWGGRLDTGDNRGKIKMLFPMSPSIVTVKAEDWPAPIDGYQFKGKDVAKEDVLHLKFLDPRQGHGRMGLSPIEVALANIDQSNTWTKTNTTLGQNMFQKSGILKFKGKKLTKEQRQDIKSQFNQSQGGDNQGSPIVTDADFEYEDISFNPKDIEWVQGFTQATRQIVKVFQVPAEILSPERSTYENLNSAIRYFYFSKIIPEMCSLRDGLNQWLVPEWEKTPGTLWLDFDINGIEILQEERSALMKRTIDAWEAGLYTKNMALKKIGESEIGPDGEIYLLPMGAQVFTADEMAAGTGGGANPQEQLAAAIDYLKKQGIN